VLSDHGFSSFRVAVNLNTWLAKAGYLAVKPDVREAATFDHPFPAVDWSRTRAYAVGINGLYINLAGRERQGIVQPGVEQEALLTELKQRLEALADPLDGRRAIKVADRADQVYHGDLRDTGPDIIIGYYRGWRGSNESALGQIPVQEFADNDLKWSGDHCIAADEVPGILMTNRPITVENPELVDMASTILKLFGLTPPEEMVGHDLFGR